MTRERSRFALVATGLLGALFAALVLGHDPWRDEYQAWLIAHEAPTPLWLWERLHWEGHGPLYYLLIWPLARGAVDPAAMRFVVLPAALAALVLLMRRLPGLPLGFRVAIAISPVFLQVRLDQPYAFVALFLLAAEAIRVAEAGRPRRRLASWLCLGLAAMADLPGAVIGGVLGLDRLATAVARGDAGSRWARLRPELPGALVGGALALTGVLATLPQAAGSQSVFLTENGGGLPVLWELLARIPAGGVSKSLPIPVGLLLFLLPLPVLRWSERAVLALGVLVTAPAAIVGGASEVRHTVALFVLIVILLARAGHHGRLHVNRPRWESAAVLAWVWAAVLVVAGLATLARAVALPRSMANDAAEWLRPQVTASTRLVVAPDFISSAFVAILDRPAWTAECACETWSILWTAERNARALDRIGMRALAVAEAERLAAAGEDVVLVLQPRAVGDAPAGWPAPTRFAGGQLGDEDVEVWRSPR